MTFFESQGSGPAIRMKAAADSILDVWKAMGGNGFFGGDGLQTRPKTVDGVGYYCEFPKGIMYWTPTEGVHVAFGNIFMKWVDMDVYSTSSAHVLGFPTSDEMKPRNGIGRISHFERGAIYCNDAGDTFERHGPIYRKWLAMGGTGSFGGAPVSDVRTENKYSYILFKDAMIWFGHSKSNDVVCGPFEVHGSIYKMWKSLGGFGRTSLGAPGPGFPMTDELDSNNERYSVFENGKITWTSQGGAKYSNRTNDLIA